MTIVRLAPLLFVVAMAVGCGTPSDRPVAPAGAEAADVEEISLEISALM